MIRRLPLLLALSTLLACSEKDGDDGDAGCDAAADSDSDGLDDCAEAELGTDPQVADSDGDGLSDGDEAACVSDPLDAAEQCYACGWPHGDPGGLSSTGSDEGDTIANIGLLDQCEESVPLHDLAGQWVLLFMTAEWCGACISEAKELDELDAELAARSDVPFTPAVVLFEDRNGGLPDAGAAVRYKDVIDDPAHPIFADPDAAVLDHTPYNGRALPGLCLLSPDMEMVECTDGHGNLEDLIAIAESSG